MQAAEIFCGVYVLALVCYSILIFNWVRHYGDRKNLHPFPIPAALERSSKSKANNRTVMASEVSAAVPILTNNENGTQSLLLTDAADGGEGIAPAVGNKHRTRRQQILDVCGDLCDLSRPIHTPNPDFGYFGETTSRINCPALFASTILDDPGNFTIPPKWSNVDASEEFIDDFRMGGRASVQEWWIQDMFLGKKAKVPHWKKETIDEWKEMTLRRDFTKFGNYQLIDRSTLYDVLVNVSRIQNQSVLVIGSESPWIEAIALAAGASKVTTLEYGNIVSEHPQVVTYTPDKFRRAYLDNTLEKFDAVISYSSLEHSGLGRYGDALNPWGDIMGVARAWCVTKQHATLTLGLSSGNDIVYFNAGRIYGKERWPYVTTNWKRVSYSSGWGKEVIDNAPKLYRRLRGPPGYEIFWNQSSLVFRRSGPPGSPDELTDASLLY